MRKDKLIEIAKLVEEHDRKYNFPTVPKKKKKKDKKKDK